MVLNYCTYSFSLLLLFSELLAVSVLRTFTNHNQNSFSSHFRKDMKLIFFPPVISKDLQLSLSGTHFVRAQTSFSINGPPRVRREDFMGTLCKNNKKETCAKKIKYPRAYGHVYSSSGKTPRPLTGSFGSLSSVSTSSCLTLRTHVSYSIPNGKSRSAF